MYSVIFQLSVLSFLFCLMQFVILISDANSVQELSKKLSFKMCPFQSFACLVQFIDNDFLNLIKRSITN